MYNIIIYARDKQYVKFLKRIKINYALWERLSQINYAVNWLKDLLMTSCTLYCKLDTK